MSKSEDFVNDTSIIEYDTGDHMGDIAHDGTTDVTTRKKTNRPKVALAATVTCPECGFGNKPEWLSKSQRNDSYATTMFCEQCGSLMAVWALHVDVQVVVHK